MVEKKSLHLTAEQVQILLGLAEGVLEVIESSTSEDEIDIRSVDGIPTKKEQLSQLGRVWYKLRRLLGVPKSSESTS